MNEGPRKPRAEGQFSPYGLKGQSQPKITDFQRPRCGVFKSWHTASLRSVSGDRGRSPISNSPSDSHGATSLIRSYPESLLFSRSGMLDSLRPWAAARQASLSFTISQSLLKLVSIESVMPSNHLILSPPSPPALNLSQHQGPFQ